LSVGDEVSFTVAGKEYKYGIEAITGPTSAIINKPADINIVSQPLKVTPSSPYRKFNRKWHLAGHKLREPTTTISSVIANNRFEVLSTEDIFSGDQVLINGDLVTIRRVSENEIITQSAISPLPIVGDTFKKLAIQRVYFGPNELIYGRDWDYTNTTEAIVNIDDLAEFNITQENNTPEFVRSTGLQNFFKHAHRLIKLSEGPTETFFYSWRPSEYPNEIQYCGETTSFDPPTNARSNGMMNWSMKGDAFR